MSLNYSGFQRFYKLSLLAMPLAVFLMLNEDVPAPYRLAHAPPAPPPPTPDTLTPVQMTELPYRRSHFTTGLSQRVEPYTEHRD